MKRTVWCLFLVAHQYLEPGLAVAAPSAPITPMSVAPPLGMDLDAFDSRRQSITLANSQVLAYIDMGNAAGSPVILIHGFTDNARDWAPMVPYLGRQFRLIPVDIRGHGKSGKPECCYTRFDFAYDIKLLMDALKIDKADIVGHSLGSIIAQTLGEYWPERVHHVVLISSTGGIPPDAARARPNFDYAAEIRKLKEPIDPDSPFMISWWASPKPVNEDFIRRQRKDAAAIPLRVWLAVLEQSTSQINGYADLQAGLRLLKAPTLLVWGSDDPIMEEPARESLRRALPSAAVKVFEGLGHNLFWEEPRAVAMLVNRFLQE
jgi:pimeloyl-ACP methyl ester carboxylesterase